MTMHLNSRSIINNNYYVSNDPKVKWHTELITAIDAQDGQRIKQLLHDHEHDEQQDHEGFTIIADVNAKNKNGLTPLMAACLKGYEEGVELLLHEGARLDDACNSGWTPFMYASSGGHLQVVMLLLKAGAEIDQTSEDGSTPLMRASDMGHADVVKFMLENGASVNAQSLSGWTALMQAAEEGHLDVAKVLLEYGANVRLKNEERHDALSLAKINEHCSIADLIESTLPFYEVCARGLVRLCGCSA